MTLSPVDVGTEMSAGRFPEHPSPVSAVVPRTDSTTDTDPFGIGESIRTADMPVFYRAVNIVCGKKAAAVAVMLMTLLMTGLVVYDVLKGNR